MELDSGDDREVDLDAAEGDDDLSFGGKLSFPSTAEKQGSKPSRLSQAPDVASMVVGKAATPADVDLEMQPLVASGGPNGEGGARQVEERPKKKLYNVWPSRNKFFCRGTLMTGGETEMGITPNCSVPNLCVWTCILAPCSLYFIWVFPHLWKEGVYALPLATLAVFLMATGFLLATCCSDPGIIPRREVVIATKTAQRLQEELGYDLLVSGSVPLDGRGGARNLPVELTSRGYRWCRTCRIMRPPRASHCPDCDNCVMRYDHHCPFVNNCVGQRNYHFFFGFVTSVLCLAMMVLPVLFWFLNSDNFELAVDGMMHISSGALQPVFYGLIALGSLIGIATMMSFMLWLYHLFLIATRRTTKEFRKDLANIAEEPTLCASRGARLFDPWALVDPRDLIRADEAPPPTPSNLCSDSCAPCFGGDDY
ncbi:unnamed protein product [Polarella glacialis]|uniref:Palmitoyltransferase n=1 Tax=Polarella glacialis TaxID=89957 RepID=A0A813EBT4_POLGL|nr:unnamed protein product [Polarella glacialis]CAE8700271.1 unnamed protein product [Polarella glacialis]CAE8718117.1 unnamed protein product [Polarella glacialis]